MVVRNFSKPNIRRKLKFVFICASLSYDLSNIYLSLYIYIYRYLYIYMLWKSRFWPSLTLFKVNILAKSKSIFWPRSFSHYKNRGFRAIFFAQLSLCVCVCVCVCVFFLFPIIWQFSKNSLFQKKGAKIGFFNFLCFKFRFWKFSFFRSAKTL